MQVVDSPGIRIGTAGWSIPRQSAVRFNSAGSHLARFSLELSCTEINSSFYRPHAISTSAKWRDATPEDFRFAVKMPRVITHELKLQRARQVVCRLPEAERRPGHGSGGRFSCSCRRRCRLMPWSSPTFSTACVQSMRDPWSASLVTRRGLRRRPPRSSSAIGSRVLRPIRRRHPPALSGRLARTRVPPPPRVTRHVLVEIRRRVRCDAVGQAAEPCSGCRDVVHLRRHRQRRRRSRMPSNCGTGVTTPWGRRDVSEGKING